MSDSLIADSTKRELVRLSAVIKRLDGDIFYQIEKIFEGALVTPPSALQPFCGKPMFCKDFDDF
ncbi:hypothetical protein K460107A9_09450 [Streptococcus pasteurianus]